MFPEIAFMVAVSGMAMLGGFGMTLAKTKRRHPSSFSKVGILFVLIIFLKKNFLCIPFNQIQF